MSRFIIPITGVDASGSPQVINGVVGVEPGDRIINVVMVSGSGSRERSGSFATVVPYTQMVVQRSDNLAGFEFIALIERADV